MKNVKIFSLLSCISIFLLTVAVLTVNNTFSLEDDEANWNISLYTTEENVIIDKTRIDFYKTLGINESYSFELDVINGGNKDAEILRAIKSNLSDYVVGTSSTTNKTYYLSDYIKYNVTYLETNKTNDVFSNDKVQSFDHLKANTTNKIKVEISLSGNDVTQDELSVLHSLNESNKLDISLYLHLDYTEL